MLLQAQVSKTANVTAGNLKTVLTAEELATVTNLTLTGKIDASDFKTMRDDMPNLAEIDLIGTEVVAYTGTEGTDPNIRYYLDNEIPYYAFYDQFAKVGKTSLTIVTFPSSVTLIKESAFMDCTGLTSVTIPNSVTEIGFRSFDGCTGLTSVTIPPSVTAIEQSTFSRCTSLTQITIPSSITSISVYAFSGNHPLFTVDYNNPKYSSKDGFLFNKAQDTLVFCPTSKMGSYIIPSSVTYLGSHAFEGCSDLTSVTIPLSVNYF